MTLAAVNNLSEIQKHACKMTCTLTEAYSEGSTLTDPIPKEGLLGLFILAIIVSLVIAGILWYFNIGEEPPAMKSAIAHPPYIGQAKKHYSNDPSGIVVRKLIITHSSRNFGMNMTDGHYAVPARA